MADLSFTPQPFAEHYKKLNWKQGEHLLIAAPTGAGKTTIAQQLVQKRRHVVMLVSKLHDPTLQAEFKGWHRATSWPPPRWEEKVLLWPKPTKKFGDNVKQHREVFGEALDDIGAGQGWTVLVDELHYTASREFAGLGAEIALLHHQGRSSGNTVVSLTQRPAWVPKIIYSSVTHAYIARTRDKDDLKRLSDLGGIDPRQVGSVVSQLPTRHDYLYVNPQGDSPPRIVNVRK